MCPLPGRTRVAVGEQRRVRVPAGDRLAETALGERILDAEAQILVQRDLGDRHLEHHLPRNHVDPFHDVQDQLVVALGREHDERVGDVVGDDAHLLLEDRRRTLRLSGRARRSRGTTGERDAAGGAGRTGPARPETARPSADPTPSAADPPTGAADPAAPAAEPAARRSRNARHTGLLRCDPSPGAADPATPCTRETAASTPAAEAATAAGAAATHAPGAEETDAGGCRARRAPEPSAATARAASEELVQHGGEIRGLGVLNRVHERLAPGALLGRNVEQLQPPIDLVEDDGIEGDRHDRVEARERDQVGAALPFPGRRHAVGREEAEDLVRELVRVTVLHLEHAGMQVAEDVRVEGDDEITQPCNVRLQVRHHHQVRARVRERVTARRDERLQDVHHLVRRHVPDGEDLDDEGVVGPRALPRAGGRRHDGARLRLCDGQDLVDVADLHRRNAVIAQNLVEEREEILAGDLPVGTDRDLALDAGVDRVADAEGGREAVDHLTDVGALEVEDHCLLFAERLVAARGRRRRRRLLDLRARRSRRRQAEGGHYRDRLPDRSPLHVGPPRVTHSFPAASLSQCRPRPLRVLPGFCFMRSSFCRTSGGSCWSCGFWFSGFCGTCATGGAPGTGGRGTTPGVGGFAPKPAAGDVVCTPAAGEVTAWRGGCGIPGRTGTAGFGGVPPLESTTSGMLTTSPEGEVSVTPHESIALTV